VGRTHFTKNSMARRPTQYMRHCALSATLQDDFLFGGH
jgi:hypothetical protein